MLAPPQRNYIMRRPLIVQFAGAAQVSSSKVGGEAASLIRMIDAGFPVPSGAVLTTTFFAPWIDSVKTSAPWKRLTRAAPEEWAPFAMH